VYLADGIALIWCNKKGNFDYIAKCRQMMEALLLVRNDGSIS
jgi:hypothetical protein